MNEYKRIKSITNMNRILTVVVPGLIFISLTLASWLLPSRDFSDSERRKLAQRPALSLEVISDGSFMTGFEKYTLDQFPLRNQFRTLKAYTIYHVFGQLDNYDIYIKDGYAAKLEYPLHTDSLEHATDRFEYIYEKYLMDKKMDIYLSIVPDKSYFLAEKYGYLSMDYKELCHIMQNSMDYANYIDITKTLDITDYYKTDTHWRQEKLPETAAVLAESMGASISGNYTEYALALPFYGVYYGQSALPLPPETLYYLSNDVLDSCIVTNHEDQTIGGIYNMEKKSGKDPYEIFLSGPRSLITIENPNCKSNRELIIFRDSFGSSIAPLLAEGYAKITLVDIRYLRADLLDRFIEFKNQDVLFLYSTSVLNHSETLT